MSRLLITTILLCGGLTSVCAAQSPVTLAMTIGLSTQGAGDNDQPYFGPSLRGSSVAGALFADAQLRPRVGIGAELSLSDAIRGRQQQRVVGGTNDLRTRHRDTMLSGVFKYQLPEVWRVSLAAVGGAGPAWRHTARIGTFRADVASLSGPLEVEQTLSDVVFSTTVGFDLSMRFTPRAALIWAGRYHFLRDHDRDDHGRVRRGIESSLFRFGGGVRLAF
jgi:hypothetical protein